MGEGERGCQPWRCGDLDGDIVAVAVVGFCLLGFVCWGDYFCWEFCGVVDGEFNGGRREKRGRF